MGTAKLVVPPRATAQALRNVLKNGLDASPDTGVGDAPDRSRRQWLSSGSDGHGRGDDGGDSVEGDGAVLHDEEAGQGMGLGLFLTRSIVDQIGGTLNIASESGKGTRVVLTLPLGAR